MRMKALCLARRVAPNATDQLAGNLAGQYQVVECYQAAFDDAEPQGRTGVFPAAPTQVSAHRADDVVAGCTGVGPDKVERLAGPLSLARPQGGHPV